MPRYEIPEKLVKEVYSSSYLNDHDILNNQPEAIARSQGWGDLWDTLSYNVTKISRENKREIVDLHSAFLSSLVDSSGYLTLFRAMEKRGFQKARTRIPDVGDVVDIGPYWTYSSDADLSSAETYTAEGYDIVFRAKVDPDQVDWAATLEDHLGRWHGEKQIYVRGPVEITGVMSLNEFERRSPKDFSVWLRLGVP